MYKYKVFHYNNFEDYQHGHGEKVLETKLEQTALNIARSYTYGGREITTISKDDKPYMLLINGKEEYED